MKPRAAALSPHAQAAVGAAGVAVLAIVVWFVLVSPKRAEATRLAEQVVAAESTLAQLKAAARTNQGSSAAADVLRLAKAMPSSRDQAGLVLEVDRLVRRSNLTLTSIAVEEPVAVPGAPTTIPVTVTVGGSYRQVTRLLTHLRQLVSFRGRELRALGRLLTVRNVDLVESKTAGFPQLEATIALSAYVYDGPIVAATPATPPDPGTEDASAESTAAGATP